MTTSAPGAHSIFPLTVFDRVFERTTFVTGWLVEGEIDTAALAAALDRVTEKWRMLSGRLESSGGQDKTVSFIIPWVVLLKVRSLTN